MKTSGMLITLLIWGTFAAAQPASASIAELNRMVLRLKEAMIKADSNELAQLTHPLLSYGHSGGRMENQSAFIHSLVSGKSDFLNMELSEQSIVCTGKTALVRHTLEADINDQGNPGNVKLKVLLVWVKSKGNWKLLGRQAIKINP